VNTFDYSSPDFYRFSEDSLHLARLVADEIDSMEASAPVRILDLCAGAGVVGLEIIQAHPEKDITLDFCELLPEFLPHLKINMARFLLPQALNKSRIYIQPLSSLLVPKFKHAWDIVVANPPYYHQGHFSLSPKSDLKNHCRFFLKDSFEIFYETLEYVLSPGGKAFFTSLKDGAANHQKILDRIRGDFAKKYADRVRIEKKGEGGGASIFLLTSLK
jgi:tRNA1(Val) A37 N6-methylase TrmN6